MSNRNLTAQELAKAQVLLDLVRGQLLSLSGGDPGLLFALRRKVYKELSNDELDMPNGRPRTQDAARTKWPSSLAQDGAAAAK